MLTSERSIQKLFSGDDYGFRWVGDWYEYDSNGGALARKARDQEAKRLKSEGWTVKKFSLGQQLVSKGGIGSSRPHIELFVPCYGLNAWKSPEPARTVLAFEGEEYELRPAAKRES